MPIYVQITENIITASFNNSDFKNISVKTKLLPI